MTPIQKVVEQMTNITETIKAEKHVEQMQFAIDKLFADIKYFDATAANRTNDFEKHAQVLRRRICGEGLRHQGLHRAGREGLRHQGLYRVSREAIRDDHRLRGWKSAVDGGD